MNWTAIVPIKAAAQRKTRLAPAMDAMERLSLSETMVNHVLGVLEGVPSIRRIALLSPQPRAGYHWVVDRGRGLNAELEAARAANAGMNCLIIHADLPLLTRQDVGELLLAAEKYAVAMAPDRLGTGTNAVAICAGIWLDLSFGPGSRRLHEAQLGNPAALVQRRGLALDVDTTEDLKLVKGEAVPSIPWES